MNDINEMLKDMIAVENTAKKDYDTLYFLMKYWGHAIHPAIRTNWNTIDHTPLKTKEEYFSLFLGMYCEKLRTLINEFEEVLASGLTTGNSNIGMNFDSFLENKIGFFEEAELKPQSVNISPMSPSVKIKDPERNAFGKKNILSTDKNEILLKLQADFFMYLAEEARLGVASYLQKNDTFSSKSKNKRLKAIMDENLERLSEEELKELALK